MIWFERAALCKLIFRMLVLKINTVKCDEA